MLVCVFGLSNIIDGTYLYMQKYLFLYFADFFLMMCYLCVLFKFYNLKFLGFWNRFLTLFILSMALIDANYFLFW